MGLLDGKNAVVWGVANRRSIAWAIAQALSGEGAQLALTYQGERLEKNVRECADQIPGTLLLPADVTNDTQIQRVYDELEAKWSKVDIIIHSVAYAPSQALEGQFLDTSREDYRVALEVSAYSLVAITRPALPLMKAGGSVVTMTYIASQRVFPSYNVMGVAKAALESTVRYLATELGPSNIRVNAISAGPISTLAARGVKGFTGFAQAHAGKSPLGRKMEAAEVGDTALFLASDLSRAITGEIIYVDQGYHVLGI
ncbi:MAG: enoyl-ACP reductase FabI [Chloroflexota bacterium]